MGSTVVVAIQERTAVLLYSLQRWLCGSLVTVSMMRVALSRLDPST